MKNILTYILFLFMIVALYGAAFASAADEPAGKKVFVDSKCGACHAVSSAKIETKSKKPASDLSSVGATKKADFINKLLSGQEKIDGKAHKKFTGSNEDLKKLVDWLGTLKAKK